MTPLAFADRLWDALGPALVVALPGSPWRSRAATRADLVLGSFVAVCFVALLPVDAHFDRYVLPLIPVLGALAAGSALRRWRSRSVAAACVVDRRHADLTRTDTREAAAGSSASPGRSAVAADPRRRSPA